MGGAGIQAVLLDWLQKGPMNLTAEDAGYYSLIFTCMVLIFRGVSGFIYDWVKAYMFMYLLNGFQVALWCILLIQQTMPQWHSDSTSTIVLVALLCLLFGFGVTAWAPLAMDITGGTTAALMVTALASAQLCGNVIMGTFLEQFGEKGMYMPFAALMFGLHVAASFLAAFIGRTKPSLCQEEVLIEP